MEKPTLSQWGFKDDYVFMRLYNQSVKIKSFLWRKRNTYDWLVNIIGTLPTIAMLILIIYVVREVLPDDINIVLHWGCNILIWVLLICTWKYTFNSIVYCLWIILIKSKTEEYKMLVDEKVEYYCEALREYDEQMKQLYKVAPHCYRSKVFEYWEINVIEGEAIHSCKS